MPPAVLSPQIVELEERRAVLAARISRLPRGSSIRRRLEARQSEICRALLVLEAGPLRSPRPPMSVSDAESSSGRAVDEAESNPKVEWWQKW